MASRKAEVVFRLVCSGISRPGQTSVEILDSMATDTLLDVAFAMIVDGLDEEQRRAVVKQLALLDLEDEKQFIEIDEGPKTVPVTKSDGTVVFVSRARWERLRNNSKTSGSLDSKRKG